MHLPHSGVESRAPRFRFAARAQQPPKFPTPTPKLVQVSRNPQSSLASRGSLLQSTQWVSQRLKSTDSLPYPLPLEQYRRILTNTPPTAAPAYPTTPKTQPGPTTPRASATKSSPRKAGPPAPHSAQPKPRTLRTSPPPPHRISASSSKTTTSASALSAGARKLRILDWRGWIAC